MKRKKGGPGERSGLPSLFYNTALAASTAFRPSPRQTATLSWCCAGRSWAAMARWDGPDLRALFADTLGALGIAGRPRPKRHLLAIHGLRRFLFEHAIGI